MLLKYNRQRPLKSLTYWAKGGQSKLCFVKLTNKKKNILKNHSIPCSVKMIRSVHRSMTWAAGHACRVREKPSNPQTRHKIKPQQRNWCSDGWRHIHVQSERIWGGKKNITHELLLDSGLGQSKRCVSAAHPCVQEWLRLRCASGSRACEATWGTGHSCFQSLCWEKRKKKRFYRKNWTANETHDH